MRPNNPVSVATLRHLGSLAALVISSILPACSRLEEISLWMNGFELTPRKVPGALALHDLGREIPPDHIFLQKMDGNPMAIDRQGKLALLETESELQLVEVATAKILKTLPRSPRWGSLFRAAFSPTSSMVWFTFSNNFPLYSKHDANDPRDIVWSWNYETGKTEIVATATTPREGCWNLRFSPDGSLLVYNHGPSNTGYLTIREVVSGRAATVEGHGFLCFSADGRLLSDGKSGWDLGSFPRIEPVPQAKAQAFAPDGRRAYGYVQPERPYLGNKSNRNALVPVYETATWKTLEVWDLPRAHYDVGYGCMAMTSDGRRLLIQAAEGIGVWDVQARKEIAFLREKHVAGMQLLPDDKHVMGIKPIGIAVWTLP